MYIHNQGITLACLIAYRVNQDALYLLSVPCLIPDHLLLAQCFLLQPWVQLAYLFRIVFPVPAIKVDVIPGGGSRKDIVLEILCEFGGAENDSTLSCIQKNFPFTTTYGNGTQRRIGPFPSVVKQILSLPMYPELAPAKVRQVAETIVSWDHSEGV